MAPSPPLPHITIFPFLSKGHTIPLLHLARLLLDRHLATITFFTTPLNAQFIRDSLPEAQVVELHFPENTPPLGIESTENIPSMSLFLPFLKSTSLLQPSLEEALSRLPHVTLLISDHFYGWSARSASKFSIPRMVFYGMSNFAVTVCNVMTRYLLVDEPFVIPGFPDLRITRDDLSYPFNALDQDSPLLDLIKELRRATGASHGIVVNSFYELESAYVDYWNRDFGPKAWCVGPLCLAQPMREGSTRSELLEWLDSRSDMKRPVLYVAFGTQVTISDAQIQEIAIGLEESGLDFFWVLRTSRSEFIEHFEERVSSRGRVVMEWVDQLEILRHKSIRGFVSHCGWNSVMESICAGVPILARPMIAEQCLNAKFVVDELKIGMRIRARDGTRDGLVVHEDVSEMARELVLGEQGRKAREEVTGFAELAAKAMMDGGSSAITLEMLIEELSRNREELQDS